MKPKKILILIPTLVYGGAERTAVTLSRSLKKLGHKPMICLFEKRIDYPYDGDLEVLGNRSSRSWMQRCFNFLSKYVKTIRVIRQKKPDVVLSFMETANNINILSKIFYPKARRVLTVRTYLSKWQAAHKGIYHTFLKVFIRLFYRFADVVLTNSRASAEDIKKNYNIPAKKVRTIYNPVDVDINLQSSEEVDYAFDKPTIVTHGRLVKEKGHKSLIAAFAHLRREMDCQLLIIGEGSERDSLKEAIKNHNLERDVTLTGYLKNPFAYIAKSTVYVLSSFFEGFPNALVEAMACKTPVISFDCLSGPREILGDNEFGILVPVGDENALTGAMKRLIGDENLRKEYSAKAFKRLREFSVEKITGEYNEVLCPYKIAQLISTYLPDIGGAENCIHNISARLSGMGHEIHVITPKRRRKTRFNYNIINIPRVLASLVFRNPEFAKGLFVKYLERLQKKHDFDLWQITVGYPFGYAASAFFEKYQIPCVLRCTGVDIQRHEASGYGYRLNAEVDERIKKTYPLYNRCVANSKSMANEYANLGIDRNKIEEIPNGIDFERLRKFEKGDYLRERFHIVKDKKLILTVGRNDPKKNFQQIPEIIERLLKTRDDFAWVIIGRGVKSIRVDSKLKDYLFLHDEIVDLSGENLSWPSDRLLGIYKSADLFVFPSLIEGLSSVVIEAMACGLPVVTTDVPGCRDIKPEHDKAKKIVEAGKIGELVESIHDVLDDASLKSSLAEKGQFISVMYDWNKITENYLDLYRQVIS